MKQAISNQEPALLLFNLMCRVAGYEPPSVKSLEVRFEVDKAITFTVEFLPNEENLTDMADGLKELTEQFEWKGKTTRWKPKPVPE